MAVAKKVFDEVTKKKLKDKWGELKTWVSSPGGLITIAGFVVAFILISRKENKE